MILIAAVTRNGVLGRDGDLAWRSTRPPHHRAHAPSRLGSRRGHGRRIPRRARQAAGQDEVACFGGGEIYTVSWTWHCGFAPTAPGPVRELIWRHPGVRRSEVLSRRQVHISRWTQPPKCAAEGRDIQGRPVPLGRDAYRAGSRATGRQCGGDGAACIRVRVCTMDLPSVVGGDVVAARFHGRSATRLAMGRPRYPPMWSGNLHRATAEGRSRESRPRVKVQRFRYPAATACRRCG